jgi:hypothetical protein
MALIKGFGGVYESRLPNKLVFMRVLRILSRIYHQTYHQLASNKKPVSPYRLLFPKVPIRVTDITLVAHLSLAGRVAVYICGALPVLTGKSQQVDLMQYVPGHYSAVRIYPLHAPTACHIHTNNLHLAATIHAALGLI